MNRFEINGACIEQSRRMGWSWLKIAESEVKGSYERDKTPDPLRYYVKDYPYYSTDNYPQLTIIPSRYTKPDYPTTIPPASKVPRIFKCDLCDAVFNNEEELSNIFREDHINLSISCRR